MTFWLVLIALSGLIAWGPAALGWITWKAAIWANVVGVGGVVVLRVERWWHARKADSQKSPKLEKFDDTEADVISLDERRDKAVRNDTSNPLA